MDDGFQNNSIYKDFSILVVGSTVRARNVGSDFFALLKNLVGGEVVSYSRLLESGPEEDLKSIRKKYLKLSKEHHPDILMSKGVPKEIIEESK